MLFQHSIIYMLAKAIPGLMAFAALAVYTHLLSPDEYGVYTLIFISANLIHNIVFNWMAQGTLRFWSNGDYSAPTFLKTLATSYSRIMLFVLAIVITCIIGYWNRQEAIWIINTFLFIVALAIYTITQNLLTAKIQPLNYAYLTILYSILAFGLGAFFASLGYGASGVITGITLGALLPSLLLFKKTWTSFNEGSFDRGLYKKLLAYGLPLASAALLEELTKVSDRFMLAFLQDKSQAGFYAVGYDLSGNSIFLIMSAINLAAYPVIIKLLDNGKKKEAMDYFCHYTLLLLGISIPAVVGLNLVGPDLVYLLIDKEYQPSVIFLLPWITSAIFLMGLQIFYFDLAFQLGHYTMGIVKIGLVIAAINIAMNYWLIPQIGIQGAAIATISSFAVGAILSAIFGRKYFVLPFPHKELGKIILATFVMGFCLWWIKDLRGWGWLVFQLCIGLISYSSVIIAFNMLNIRDTVVNFFIKKAKSA